MFLLATFSSLVATWTYAANHGAAHGLPLWIGGVFVGDKVVHFLIVGLFAVLVARAIRRHGYRPATSLLAGMAIAAILATIEEATNALTPHRTCSVADLLADYAGIVTLSAVAWLSDLRDGPQGLGAWLASHRPQLYRPHAAPNGG
ncbi:VanZ family protein [Botrimarina hoheduenensis]|uniref:VanZ like family protein n=1 Tax=Botrimarina hoheduenensis TaxID=2528000 RepID=A0A5C5VZB9_9BACT|nr:VanZ family protein [Botrimarina hoheduenensis]TWT43323.1 hypothetical protein Pla111_22740 [Botrimarina hoheduenensis]